MSNSMEIRECTRLLSGLENGNMTASDAFTVADKRDPVMLYFILRFLREKYPAGRETSAGVLQRVLELTGTYDSVVKKSKTGEKDPMREWFDDTYAMREFFDKSDEFVEMLVEKMEG